MLVNNIRFYWEHHIKHKITTAVAIDHTTGVEISRSHTACSKKDSYVKEKGRRISLQRLLTVLGPIIVPIYKDREAFRIKVWEIYRTSTNPPRWNTKKEKQELKQKLAMNEKLEK